MLRDRYSKAEKGRNFKQTFSLGLPTSFNEKSFLFFNFFNDFGVPILLSICLSMTKGERDVTAFSSIYLITKNRAKPSLPLNTK